MITDAENTLILETAYDVCIIGAGAAGITLALQFEKSSHRVCVLEAGGRGYESDVQELFRGETDAAAYPPLRDMRLGAFGGTTSVWAGWCRPLEELDFESRDGSNTGGWPFGREQLLSYYERAHEVCGLGAFEYGPEYWTPLLGGGGLLANDSTFSNRIFLVNGQRFGERFLSVLEQSKNVDVVLHAPVIRLNPDQNADKVAAVEVRTAEGHVRRVRANVFVLAAGGIENPRLLMLSTDAQNRTLGNGSGLVGRYFSDHLFVDPGTLVFHDRPQLLDFYLPKPIPAGSTGKTSVRGVLSLRADTVRRDGLLNAALFFYPQYEAHRAFASDAVKALLQVWAKARKRAVPGNAGPYLRRAARAPHWAAVALIRKIMVRDAPARRWRMRAMFESEFRCENRVMLSDKKDRLGRARSRVVWHLSERDLWSMSRVMHLFDQSLRRAGIGHLARAFPDDPASWRAAVEGGKHHMGTTRMHSDARHGVVDENCKVHGTSNLYIAGSSVFPSGGYANPTLTIVALAIRLADHIKRVL